MFMGPLEDMKPWSTKGIVGSVRFLDRVWRLGVGEKLVEDMVVSEELDKVFNKTIKKVSEDIENFKYNTAISALMILLNEFEKQASLKKQIVRDFLIMLSPFAPHITEELWERLGGEGTIMNASWPVFDENKLTDGVFQMAVQVNGRVRAIIEMSSEASEQEAQQAGLANEQVQKWLAGKKPQKLVYVPGKLLSIVAK